MLIIYSIIISVVAGIATGLCAYFYNRYRHWFNRFISSGYNTELELATIDQIIKELRNRPNSSYVILEPQKDDKSGLIVTTYACNIKADLILASLQAAKEGIVDHLGLEGYDVEIELGDFEDEDQDD